MKTVASKLIIVIILLAISLSIEAKTDKKTVTFNVMMSNSSAKKEIEKNIGNEEGVLNLKVNPKENTAVITYDANKTNVETILKAFKKAGYTAFPVGENCSMKKGGCLNNPAIEVNTMK
jgi:copper chaperone CopZ